MKIFDGLTTDQIQLLRRESVLRQFAQGETLFREEDPAYGLYIIYMGRVEILRNSTEGPVKLAEAGPDEVIGEIGLVRSSQTRTATVRTLEPTIALELPGNPLELIKKFPDKSVGIRFLQNLICILARRLRGKDAGAAKKFVPGNLPAMGDMAHYREWIRSELNSDEAIEEIDSLLPKGLLTTILRRKSLAPGEVLCSEGDDPDGFYFIRTGALEVYKNDEGKRRKLGVIEAPNVVGEAGFFANEPRTATLLAESPLEFTHFTASDFKKLKKHSPEDAFKILYAASRLLICLILHKEAVGG